MEIAAGAPDRLFIVPITPSRYKYISYIGIIIWPAPYINGEKYHSNFVLARARTDSGFNRIDGRIEIESRALGVVCRFNARSSVGTTIYETIH